MAYSMQCTITSPLTTEQLQVGEGNAPVGQFGHAQAQLGLLAQAAGKLVQVLYGSVIPPPPPVPLEPPFPLFPPRPAPFWPAPPMTVTA
jgi:hypothetical protein